MNIQNLSGYEIALQRIEENRINRAPLLDLSNLQLTNIPQEIGELNHLNYLDLKNNRLGLSNLRGRFLPTEMRSLEHLQTLILSGNRLRILYGEIEEFKVLRTLELGNNEFTSIPEQINNLISLRQLNFSNNRLSKLPEEIGRLVNLRHLLLNHNKLIELPNNIVSLHLLEQLNLNSNNLTELSSAVCQLKSLKKLYLRDNHLKQIPAQINKLTGLEYFTCRNNKIDELPDEIGGLKNLQILSFRNNRLRTIPSQIGELFNLHSLYLDHNELVDLPRELDNLPNLKRLVIEGNQLNLPPEITEKWQDPKYILSYYFNSVYRADQEDLQPLKEVKVIAVGQGRVGKTSLVRYLVHNKKCKPDERSTHGILREKWNVEIVEKETQKTHNVRLNFWDFGGQDIQHQTHQFFLSKRSIYLLVLDAGCDETRNKLDYWLKKIKIYGENSPIFVAINKSDENSLKLAYNELKEKFNIKGFFNISCADGREIAELREAIKRQIGELKEVFQPIKKEWFAVKQELENIKEDYISISDYRNICKENGISNIGIQDLLLSHLHELGIILNFKHYETKVLNPEWVTRGVYRLITSSEVMKNNGILTPEILANELENLNDELNNEKKSYLCYPPEKYNFITDLMQEFELCYQVPEKKDFFVPALLPKESHYVGDWKEKNCLGFRYNYEKGILHESIISRFIVKMKRYILNNTQWLTGVLLESEHGNKALVKADISNKTVNILINGNESTRRAFLSIIRDKFSEIHESLKANEPREEVAHYDHPDYFLSYDDLLQLERAGIHSNFATIDGKVVSYDIKRLLNGVSTERERKTKVIIAEDEAENTFTGMIVFEDYVDQNQINEINDIVKPSVNNEISPNIEKQQVNSKEGLSLYKTIVSLIISFVVILAAIGLYDYLQKQGLLSQNGFYLALIFTVIFVVVVATFALASIGIIPAEKIPDILKPTLGIISTNQDSNKSNETKG